MIVRAANAEYSEPATSLARKALRVGSAVATAVVITGCGGTSAPTADEIVSVTAELQNPDPLTLGETTMNLPLVVGPLAGRGTQDLPEFATSGVYYVELRCLGEGEAAVSTTAEQQEPQPCDNGEIRAGGGGVDGQNELIGDLGQVAAQVTASDDLFWVAAIFSCQPPTALADC